MLPGKKYTPEDILRIAAKRAWIAVVAVLLCGSAAVLVSKQLPNQFRSETLIMLIPPRIPDAYVKAAVTTSIADRLNSLEDQIMSRSRLERIILDLNLYPKLRRTMPMEDVVQRMRLDIDLKTESKESFRITYVSQEAKTAQSTTERLASLFIEESIRDRENVAEDTNQFLDAQLEDAKRRLLEHEKKLEEYRTRYGGELPTQVTSNLQAIQNAQVQLQTLSETADRARERRLLLERQVAEAEAEMAVIPPPPAGTPAPNTPSTEPASVQLQRMRAFLEAQLTRLKPEHPDVKATQRQIRELEAKVAEEASKRPEASVSTPTDALRDLPAAERARQQRIRDYKLQIADIDRQLAEKQEQERKLRGIVSEYQAKLDAVPKRESELVELTRDYTTLQASYQSLLVKREDAQLAASLGRRNIGEQFKVLDPAKAPERPFSPNRLAIDLGGAGGGLAFGLLLIALLEYRDSSLRSEDDVVRVLRVRVLALVPEMPSGTAHRSKKWRLALIGAAVVVLAASGAALAIWRLR
jgi:polysaccharide chain length determinant protein (PEP-CTERM system associated)